MKTHVNQREQNFKKKPQTQLQNRCPVDINIVCDWVIVKNSNEIRVKDNRSINVTKHGLAGFIGIGSVEFSSAATDRAEVIFLNIAGANRVRDLVTNLLEA